MAMFKLQKDKMFWNFTISEHKKVLLEKTHICTPDPHKNDVLKEMSDLRDKVVTSTDPVPLLYSKQMKSLKDKGLNLVMNLPTYDGSKHFLYSARNKAAGVSRTTFKEIHEVEEKTNRHTAFCGMKAKQAENIASAYRKHKVRVF
ncbi:uncharacterized protein LOC126379814 isoform X3 [Pectinophora gossypiella]|uniref:uncharacterized protein LOC126379814 isoform X3 n=1 Tax=Pectinophora gossypiella TaxID=13191 RepID=UPI00214DFB0D|nr:uncharacterized protein LOC126379814 isoform X3 [Pectinophora gossypiella]